MIKNPRYAQLFDECPIWLWPVLIWSLLGLADELLRLEMDGDTWYEVRLTRYGQAYIARAPKRLPTWKDDLFQTVMGAPIPDPLPERPKLGITVDDSQIAWALGETFACREGETRFAPAGVTGCALGQIPTETTAPMPLEAASPLTRTLAPP